MGAEIRQHILRQVIHDQFPGRFLIRKQLRKDDLPAVPQIRRAGGPHVCRTVVFHCSGSGNRAAEHIVQQAAFPFNRQGSAGHQLGRTGKIFPDAALFPDQIVDLLRQLSISPSGQCGVMNTERLRQIQSCVLNRKRFLRRAGACGKQQSHHQTGCQKDPWNKLHFHPSVN